MFYRFSTSNGYRITYEDDLRITFKETMAYISLGERAKVQRRKSQRDFTEVCKKPTKEEA